MEGIDEDMDETNLVNYRELQTTDYLEDNGQIYLSFGWLIKNLYGRITKRYVCSMGELMACITVELPAFFRTCYYKSLLAGVRKPQNESAVFLPEPLRHLKLLVPDLKVDQWRVSNVANRGICLTIVSQGYTSDRIIYSYQFQNHLLYVSIDELYGFGLLKVNKDDVKHSIQLFFYDQRQLLLVIDSCETTIIRQIEQLNPDEIIQLWIRGQQLRSGALQYIVLSEERKQRLMQEIRFRGWITGGLSPTLNRGRVCAKRLQAETADEISYEITYQSMVMGKVYGLLKQKVTLHQYSGTGKRGFYIDSVTGDTGYYTYQNLSV